MAASGEKTSEKDVVYVHGFPRDIGRQVPNISPFDIKLETWLRLKNIKHEFIGGMARSSKGQIPFMKFNGEEYPDTSLIITMLTEHFKLDSREGLSDTELAISRAFIKMVEENTAWTYFIYRYVNHADEYRQFLRLPAGDNEQREASWKGLQEYVGQRALLHGIGRNTETELATIAVDDLTAISRYLGDKKFFHGENMTLVDCALFGQLSQIHFVDMNYPHKEVLRSSCKNVADYMQRIKLQIWPDWDQLCDNSKFKVVDGQWA